MEFSIKIVKLSLLIKKTKHLNMMASLDFDRYPPYPSYRFLKTASSDTGYRLTVTVTFLKYFFSFQVSSEIMYTSLYKG